jgi:hypothetical protein
MTRSHHTMDVQRKRKHLFFLNQKIEEKLCDISRELSLAMPFASTQSS